MHLDYKPKPRKRKDSLIYKMNVVLTGDKTAFGIHPTTINSVLSNNKGGRTSFYIYSTEFSEKKIEFEAGSIEIIRPAFRYAITDSLGRYRESHAFDRFFILRDRPNLERALFLDWDQLVVGDISDYYNIDMGENFACLSHLNEMYSSTWYPESKKFFPSNGNDPLYCLGGLININAAVKGGLLDSMVKFVHTGLVEQPIFLYCANGKILSCEHKYNLLLCDGGGWEGCHDPRIVHWTGWRKPWNDPHSPKIGEWNRYKCNWRELFEKYEIGSESLNSFIL